jgi:ATP/maltotriose-dependent transcriptional regulator MalT
MVVRDHETTVILLQGHLRAKPPRQTTSAALKSGEASRQAVWTVNGSELEVVGLIAKGATNREAAARLFISEATVKTHLLHIYAKLGVNDRAAAVAAAFERGLLTPGGR